MTDPDRSGSAPDGLAVAGTAAAALAPETLRANVGDDPVVGRGSLLRSKCSSPGALDIPFLNRSSRRSDGLRSAVAAASVSRNFERSG